MRAGRPKSASSSRAARTVRPVYSTSSTITTRAPSMSPGSDVRPDHRPRADRLQVVAVERDVEGAERHVDALGGAHRARDAARRSGRRGAGCRRARAVGARVQLDDLVGHALDRAVHRPRVEQAALGSYHGRRI
jgi:hypothetical protein